jgi:hypothetical protein
MTLDPAPEERQGAGPAIDSYLMDRLLPARGRVNCDIMARKLSKRNLRELLAALEDGVALLRDIIGDVPRDTTE